MQHPFGTRRGLMAACSARCLIENPCMLEICRLEGRQSLQHGYNSPLLHNKQKFS
jgi:hypothetical protein